MAQILIQQQQSLDKEAAKNSLSLLKLKFNLKQKLQSKV